MHFYTIYAIFTQFMRFLHDFTQFYVIFAQFYIIFTQFYAIFCNFYAIFCQAQIFCSQTPKTILHPWWWWWGQFSSLSLLQQPDSERGDADRKSEVSTGLGAENAGFEPETLGPTAVTERVGWPLDGHVFSQSVCDKWWRRTLLEKLMCLKKTFKAARATPQKQNSKSSEQGWLRHL